MMNSDKSRRRLESAVALMVALVFLLLWLGSAGPGSFRFVLGVLWLLVLPGFLLGRLFWHARRWSYVHWFAISTCLSLAMGSLVAWILYLAGANAGLLLWVQGGIATLLAVLGLAGVVANPAPPDAMRMAREPRRRAAIFLTAMLAVFIAAVLVLSPAKISYVEDALVHVATSQAVLDTGRIIPPDQLTYGTDDPGEDPRVALFHAVAAALGQGSGVEMYTVWSWLRGFFGLLWIAAFFVFARAVLRDDRWSFVAVVLFVLLYGGVNIWTHILRTVFYPSRIGMCLCWTGVGLLLDHLRWRDRDTFWIGSLLLPASAMIHVTPFLNFWVTLAALTFFLALVGKGKRSSAFQAGKALAAGTILAVPYLLTRYLASYAVANPIHLVPQQVMFLDSFWLLPLPVVVLSWFGWIGLLAFPLGLLILRRAREDEGRMLLFGNTVATLSILAIPPVFTLAFRVLNFLALRFVQVMPHITILTFYLMLTLGRIRESRWAAVRGVAFACILGVLMFPVARDHIRYHLDPFLQPGTVRENPLALAPILRDLDARMPPNSVILCDPFTGYAVLAFTHQRPMAVPVAHSSPRDSLSVARAHASSLALEPSTPPEYALDIMRRFGISHILLNHTFRRPHRDYGFSIRPERFAAQKEYFDGHPEWFEPVASWPDVYLYRLLGSSGPELRGLETGRVDRLDCEGIPGHDRPVVFDGKFELAGARILTETVSRGREMGISWCWRRVEGGQLDRDYHFHLRFDRDYDKGPLWREGYSKPYRKFLERSRGERYRFRVDIPMAGHMPLLALPVTGLAAVDTTIVRIPTDIAPGRYEVKVSMTPIVVHPNLDLRDLLRDDDCFEGVPIGWVNIE